MPDKKQVTYAPVSAKLMEFQWGQIMKLGINAEKMIAFLEEHANEKGYVNLEVKERKEEGKYGETHSVVLDDWKPKGKKKDPEDDMPF